MVLRELFTAIGLQVNEASFKKGEAAIASIEKKMRNMGQSLNKNNQLTQSIGKVVAGLNKANLVTNSLSSSYRKLGSETALLKNISNQVGKSIAGLKQYDKALDSIAKKSRTISLKTPRSGGGGAARKGGGGSDNPVEEIFDRLTAGAGLLLGGGLIGRVVGGLAGMSKQIADTAHNSFRLGIASGIAADEFQRLHLATAYFGTDYTDLADGLMQLKQSVYDAAKSADNDYARAFGDAGVKTRDLNGNVKNTLTLLYELSDGIIRTRGSVENATDIILKLFGEDSGRKLAAFLALGSKGMKELMDVTAEATPTAAQIKASRDFGYQTFLLGLRIERLKLRTFNTMFVSFSNALYRARPIVDALSVATESLAYRFSYVLEVATKSLTAIFGKAGKDTEALGKTFEGLITGGIFFSVAAGIGSVAFAVKALLPWLTAMWVEAAPIILPLLAIAAALFALYVIVDDVVGYFNGVDSVFGRLVKKFPWLDAGLQMFITGLKVLGTGAAALIQWLSQSTLFVNFLIVAFATLAIIMLAPFLAAIAPILLVVAAIVAIITAIGYVQEHFAEFSKFFKDLWISIRDFAVGTIHEIMAPFQDLLDMPKALWEKLKSAGNFLTGGADLSTQQGLVAATVGGGAVNPNVDAARNYYSQQTMQNSRVNVGQVQVNIQGNTNMSAADVQKATAAGVRDGAAQLRQTKQQNSGGSV